MTYQGSSKWNPEQPHATDPEIGQTQQFGAVPPEYSQQQYSQQPYGQQYPQQYGQPAYNQQYQGSYQQPEKRGGPNAWLIALIGVLLAALVGVLAFLGGSGAFSGSSEPVTSTVVETQTLPSSEKNAPAPAAPAAPKKERSYSNYAPDTGVTTDGFAANVYLAFQQEYARTGSPDITVTAYSPATETSFRMSCTGGATVYCVGGNNARVRIW